jgi:hypothetical protein
MTGSYFIIDDGQLYNGKQKVTHVRRLDGGGIVLGGRTVGDPMFSLTITPDGGIEGEVPRWLSVQFCSWVIHASQWLPQQRIHGVVELPGAVHC